IAQDACIRTAVAAEPVRPLSAAGWPAYAASSVPGSRTSAPQPARAADDPASLRPATVLDRKTTKNLGMYAAYQALRYIAPIVLTPFLAHALSKQQFSELVILNSCVWTSTVFMEFGFYLYGV